MEKRRIPTNHTECPECLGNGGFPQQYGEEPKFCQFCGGRGYIPRQLPK